MAIRPTTSWRESIAEEARLVAEDPLEAEFAVMAELHPVEAMERMDPLFATFERAISRPATSSDQQIMDAVRELVEALNVLHHEFADDLIATQERDEMCEYIDDALVDAGVDVDALCRRVGVERDELTDDWRHW
jgi:hypothetical protein